MIDNIILRLHGANQPKPDNEANFINYEKGFADVIVPAHFELYKKILKFKGKTFSINKIYQKEKTEDSRQTEDEFLLNNTSKKLNQHYMALYKSTFVSGDTVKKRNLKVNGKYRVPSSESDVVYSISIDGGFVEFNVNIPKYLYGHNLAQFVPQIDSGIFDPFRSGNFNEWRTQKKYLYDRLLKFIEVFLIDVFYYFELEELPNYDYVELNRIDLCYNQIFKSKTDALMYLDEQKKIHKKRTNSKSRISSDYKTSVAYHTSNGSYFKIYHKGSEYIDSKHGDFKKHESINKSHITNKSKFSNDPIFEQHGNMIFKMFKNDTLGKLFDKPENPKITKLTNRIYSDLPINTMFLKKEMDKVLRYEISLQSKSMSRLYKARVFRYNCPYHKQARKVHNAVKRYNMRVNKKGRYKPTKDDRKTYEAMHKFLNNGCFILLSKNNKYINYSKKGTADYNPLTGKYTITRLYEKLQKGTLLETRDVGFFTKNLLDLLVDDFKKQVEYYQIGELQPYDELVNKVRQYNIKADENKKVYDNLNEYKTKRFCYDQNKHVNIVKGNKVITKASQLLTEKERVQLHLQKINFTNISEIFRLMHEKKMSSSQIRDYLKLSKSSFYRRMKLLNMLGVKEQSLFLPKKIDCKTDFTDYYYFTSGFKYKKDFFLHPSHSRCDYKKEENRITMTQQKLITKNIA